MGTAGIIHISAREALALYLERQGYDAAATVLRSGNDGYVSLPRYMKDTRDGREEIAQLVGEAFEDPRISVIVIDDRDPLDITPLDPVVVAEHPQESTLQRAIREARGGEAPVPLVGYA